MKSISVRTSARRLYFRPLFGLFLSFCKLFTSLFYVWWKFMSILMGQCSYMFGLSEQMALHSKILARVPHIPQTCMSQYCDINSRQSHCVSMHQTDTIGYGIESIEWLVIMPVSQNIPSWLFSHFSINVHSCKVVACKVVACSQDVSSYYRVIPSGHVYPIDIRCWLMRQMHTLSDFAQLANLQKIQCSQCHAEAHHMLCL